MNLTGELFFTSDTHFFHQNIIKYCSRPFDEVSEMNENFVSEWNSIVTPSDTIFHLGDVALGCDNDRFNGLFSRLNGNKILVVGNHDNSVVKKSQHWSFVAQNISLDVGGFGIQLNHRPNFDGFPDWDIFLYGHVHGRNKPTKNTLDVGVDSAMEHLGSFRPWSLSDIVCVMEQFEENYQ